MARRGFALAVVALFVWLIGAAVLPGVDAGSRNCRPASKCASPTPTLAPTPSPTPTVTPSPAPTSSSDPQPVFPIRAAFYYPWFPEAWNQQGYNPFTWYTPTLGFYDSSNTAVISAHIAAMQAAGIQAGVASWWGQGSATDGRMAALLAAAGTFRWAIYYEPEGTADPTQAQVAADLDYIIANYGTKPGYLRVAGRPVVFVYNANDTTCAVADKWLAANAGRAYLVLKVFSGYRTCASQPDSWHQYAPAVAEDHQTGYSFAISPGFWKRSEATPRLTRDPTRWATNVADMVASGEPWQLVTTFSEWGEGTQVESSVELGTTYLDILGGGAPPPTPTPAVTASPTPTGGTIDHTIVVWLENHEAAAVTSTSMPYLYGLASQYGRADAYYAVTHPSLPNYLAFWSGSTQGVTDDGVYNFGGASLSSQMTAAGRSWRTYAQDYPTSGCFTGSSFTGGVDGAGVAGTYVRKHNPAMSFTSVSGNATECAKIQPLANFDPNVNVAFVVPNLCNDAHDCSLSVADSFLQGFVPLVLNAPDFAHTLLVITWDEGTTNTNGGGRVFTAVIRPGLSGVVSTTAHTHYSLLRTIESLNGLGYLGNAASANTLSEFLP